MSISESIEKAVNESSPDVKERAKRELEAEKARKIRLENDGTEQDNGERKRYAKHIFWLSTGWLFCVMIVFILVGRKVLIYSDKVLITLLTTSTANVIGLFIIVARYLFPAKKKP